MPTNLELKARCTSLEQAARLAEKLGAAYQGILVQTDTYFHCSRGRLKLRELGDGTAEIIAYQRPNTGPERWSVYERVGVAEPARLREALEGALGVRAVVRKQRTLYLYKCARIHLDIVEGLGSFIEFEVVFDDPGGAAAVLEELRRAFRVDDRTVVTGSYVDLMAGKPEESAIS